MKTKLQVLGGIVLILAGIYGLVRPNILMPAKREKLQIAGQEVEMETRRIVGVPRPLSGMVILSGVALILLTFQKP
jgi:hypothetical protein